MMRTKLLCQLLLIVTTVDCYGFKTHLSCVLHAKVAQPTNTMNRHQISSASTGVAQSVVNGDPCTHEWSGFLCWNLGRNSCERRGRCNHVLGISTIEVKASYLSVDTHREVATMTLLTNKAMAAVPANPDTLTHIPRFHTLAHGIDATRNFMTRHARILKSWPDAIFDQDIAMANTTRFHFHTHLSGCWFRHVTLDELPLSTCFANLCCSHFVPHDRS